MAMYGWFCEVVGTVRSWKEMLSILKAKFFVFYELKRVNAVNNEMIRSLVDANQKLNNQNKVHPFSQLEFPNFRQFISQIIILVTSQGTCRAHCQICSHIERKFGKITFETMLHNIFWSFRNSSKWNLN